MRKFPFGSGPPPDPDFPDFSKRSIDYVEGAHAHGHSHGLSLLLPRTSSVDELLEERRQAAQELRDQREAEAQETRARQLELEAEARKAKRAADKEEPDDSNAAKPPGVFLSAEEKEQLGQKESVEQMRRDHELLLAKVQARDEPDRFRVPIYAWDAPVKLLAGRKTNPDRETRDRDKRLFEQLRALGALRRVCAWTQMDAVLDGLRALRASQPHFSSVVDLIDARLRLAQVRDEPARIPPILLAGPPGVGKTHFTLELARILDPRGYGSPTSFKASRSA